MKHDSAAEMFAQLRALPPDERRKLLFASGEADARLIDSAWPLWAHPGQLPPHDDWDLWVMLAGRGFGKTRAGAEWVSAMARDHPGARIALVAATPQEARRVMIEGRGGLFAAARDGEEQRLMRWEPTLGRLTFASGAEAFVYSGASGDSLRGGEHHFAWCDELAKWRDAESAWDNLQLTLRAGARPRAVVTTTPRAVPAVRRLLGMPGLVLTGGASRDNPHLAPAFVRMVEAVHGGSRFGRQELEGLLIDDLEGALFSRALIEASRGPPPGEETLTRIVVGVDPPASVEGNCGIVVCARDEAGTGYVLADCSAGGIGPDGWAKKVAQAAQQWRAHLVVAEANNGGKMVESVLRGADSGLPVRLVHAADGKSARAEPVMVAFESGRAKLAGAFPALEDELAGYVYHGGYHGPGKSPDRADACVWALTELMVKPQRAEPRITLL